MGTAPVPAMNFGDWGKGETLGALGGLWRSLSDLQSTKYGKGRSEMALTGQPCRKSDLSWRSGQHRVIPELDFMVNML